LCAQSCISIYGNYMHMHMLRACTWRLYQPDNNTSKGQYSPRSLVYFLGSAFLHLLLFNDLLDNKAKCTPIGSSITDAEALPFLPEPASSTHPAASTPQHFLHPQATGIHCQKQNKPSLPKLQPCYLCTSHHTDRDKDNCHLSITSLSSSPNLVSTALPHHFFTAMSLKRKKRKPGAKKKEQPSPPPGKPSVEPPFQSCI
jgi:hypothetical protein